MQGHPPSHILQKLAWKLEDLDHIGSEWCDGIRLQKFQDGTILEGVRRAVVEGKQLGWIEGIPSLRNVFTTVFKIGEPPLGSILNQAEECWSHKKPRSYEHKVH